MYLKKEMTNDSNLDEGMGTFTTVLLFGEFCYL